MLIFQEGLCKYNITDTITSKRIEYQVIGYYSTMSSIDCNYFTYFPTIAVVREVPAMSLSSFFISMLIIVGGYVFS